MRKLRWALCGFIVMAALSVVSVPVLAATNPFQGACQTGGQASTVCKANGTDPLTGNGGVLNSAINILTLASGIIAVIMIIVGGIKYTLSSGDSSQTNLAKNTIIFSVVGLIAILLARLIVALIVNKI